MNYLLSVSLVALTLAVGAMPSGAAQPPLGTSANSSFAGTWEGKMNDLPGVNLKIEEAKSKISGSIVFYFQERSEPNGPWHVAGESTVPLLSPHVEDRVLTFEVEHRKCHGCAELGPNVRFRMELAGANEARLWNQEQAGDSESGLKLIRRTDATTPTAQEMQKGISVELARTGNAVPMPDADKGDSLIVTITDNGSVYVGIDQVSPDALGEKVKAGLSNREKKFYVKADARTAYANVLRVLDAAHTAGVEAVSLLTAQQDSSRPGTLMPPKGLEVLVGPALPAGTVATVVELLNSGKPLPTPKINDEEISWPALQSTLSRLFQKGDDRVILLKADTRLPFAHVVQAVDACRSTGARVVLATPRA